MLETELYRNTKYTYAGEGESAEQSGAIASMESPVKSLSSLAVCCTNDVPFHRDANRLDHRWMYYQIFR